MNTKAEELAEFKQKLQTKQDEIQEELKEARRVVRRLENKRKNIKSMNEKRVNDYLVQQIVIESNMTPEEGRRVREYLLKDGENPFNESGTNNQFDDEETNDFGF